MDVVAAQDGIVVSLEPFAREKKSLKQKST